MSTQPLETPEMPPMPDFKESLREAYRAVDLSVQDLWFLYRTVGGNKKNSSSVRSWVYGMTLPDIDQFVILAEVLNDRLRKLGHLDKLVPSIELRGRDSNPQPTGVGLSALTPNDLRIAA